MDCSYCREKGVKTTAKWYADHDELGVIATACEEHQDRMWEAWGITDHIDIRPVEPKAG